MTIIKAPRVLMLCGYTQNARIFRGRLGSIRKALSNYELVFLDPPHKMLMPSTESNSQFDSETPAIDEDNRAWWFSKAEEGRKTYEQFDEALVYVREFMESQTVPFDAVLGFSQGAGMASIITALLERPTAHPAFATSKIPLFKFCVLSAGFLPLDPRVSELFTPSQPLLTPSLHILGRGDTIVTADRSVALVECFTNPRVTYHSGGHHTPSKESWRTFYLEYFNSFFVPEGEEVPVVESPFESNL